MSYISLILQKMCHYYTSICRLFFLAVKDRFKVSPPPFPEVIAGREVRCGWCVRLAACQRPTIDNNNIKRKRLRAKCAPSVLNHKKATPKKTQHVWWSIPSIICCLVCGDDVGSRPRRPVAFSDVVESPDTTVLLLK